ncbi:MAG: TlpA disulfide reductase family protein [Phycisphaerales bacterium]
MSIDVRSHATRLIRLAALLGAAALAGTATAADVLKVGSKAPPITVEKWVKGTEVKKFEPGKVYVVEFWATWCGPCIQSIPHLTEIQKTHPEVTVIGVAASERKPATGDDNRYTRLVDFVKEKGDTMDYRVAYDADSSMSKAWMQPAKRSGIPSAFIVGAKGEIAWIGHPSEMDAPLAAALAKAKSTPPKSSDTAKGDGKNSKDGKDGKDGSGGSGTDGTGGGKRSQ